MKLFTIFFVVLLPFLLFGQAVDLFFSEYIEGSSNNKALEIFNGTGQKVDLSQYRIAQSVNGGGWQFYHYFPAGDSLNDGDVWVIVTDQVDPALFDTTNADEVLSFPSVVHFSGDDARGLEKMQISQQGDTTWVLIDVIGIPDQDPGAGWAVAGVPDATKDHTLIRKNTVTQGNTDWAASAGTNADDSEWIVKDQNDFSDLGKHTFGVVQDNPPVIGNVFYNPIVPTATQDLTVQAPVTDDMGLSLVELQYTVNDGDTSKVTMNQTNGDTFSAAIPATAYGDGDLLKFWVYAEDNAAQGTTSSTTQLFTGTTPIMKIHTTDSNGVLLYEGIMARVEGVATVQDSTFSLTHMDIYVQDTTGGINIFKFNLGAFDITLGNIYSIVGSVDQYRGKAEIIPNSSADITDNGPGVMPNPMVKTIAELLADPETYEGMLIQIQAVDTVSAGGWPAEGSNANITVTDDGGTSQLTLRIDKDTDIDGQPEPQWPRDVIGIFGQFDSSFPYTSGYQILPRSINDFLAPTAIGDHPVTILPERFKLYQNYPNPFNPSTTIRFNIPTTVGKSTQVKLIIYNILGQKVRTLFNGPITPGTYKFKWNGETDNGSGAPGGIYFATMQTDNFQQTIKMILLK